MVVESLWDRLVQVGPFDDRVAFEHRDLRKVISEDARAHEAGHASADDNRVLT